MAGLIPTLKALETGKNIAPANKETLVAGGQLVMDPQRKRLKYYTYRQRAFGHFQCIGSTPVSQVKRLLLTASVGLRGKLHPA